MPAEPKLPKFDPKSKCIKCGWEIPDPVAPPPKVIAGGAVAKPAPGQKKGEEKAFIFELPADFTLPTAWDVRELAADVAAVTGQKPAAKKPAAKPAEKPTGSLYQPPPPPPQPPNVFYCNGLECPWDEDDPDGTVEEHMHQCCDTCGFEWLSLPLDAK